MEVEGGSGSIQEQMDDDGESKKESIEINNKNNNNNNNKLKNSKSSYFPKLSCLKNTKDGNGNFDMEVEEEDRPSSSPSHLIIMVNGLIGSAQNWKYAAKQFLIKYPEELIIHCSECNSALLTFDGVDVMGDRLAEEVKSVIKLHPGVQKISFVAHSLGGLIARYAIAKLYGQDVSSPRGNGESKNDGSRDTSRKEKFKDKIAGLEPMNFITSATPHLGSRGHKQVPVFCGFYTLEKVAARTAWFLGRTGSHLFLADSDDGKPPLLLRMARDSEDLKFISALQSFKRRVVYANAGFDHLVGWSTSSLRHSIDLPKRQHLKRDDKYPHILKVEAKSGSPRRVVRLESIINGSETDDMEEEMLNGLTNMSWERVDVSFSGSKQRFLAHSTIQVKNYTINSDGADVIQHMIDNFLL